MRPETALRKIAGINPADGNDLAWDLKRTAQKALPLTFSTAERKALREAAKESLAGMFQGNAAALERALEKL